MLLIVLSQAVQAAQITFEDFFMADLAIPPLKIVGYEGVFGTAMMLSIMLPLVQFLPGKDGNGIHEDSIDTWHLIVNTPVIARILVMDMFALLAYNISGMCVTGHLGAVFRTVLETTRTLFVWLVDLVLFYTPLGLGKLGESWSSSSWIQAFGFVVLVAGTIIYGRGDEEEEAEIAAAEGAYEPIPEEEAMVAEGMPIRPQASMTQPISVSQASSFKASMTINALSGSLPQLQQVEILVEVYTLHSSGKQAHRYDALIALESLKAMVRLGIYRVSGTRLMLQGGSSAWIKFDPSVSSTSSNSKNTKRFRCIRSVQKEGICHPSHRCTWLPDACEDAFRPPGVKEDKPLPCSQQEKFTHSTKRAEWFEIEVRDVKTNPAWDEKYAMQVPVMAVELQQGGEAIIPRTSPRVTADKLERHIIEFVATL
eukprot:jgi/Picre1/35131/NNA_002594.t1